MTFNQSMQRLSVLPPYPTDNPHIVKEILENLISSFSKMTSDSQEISVLRLAAYENDLEFNSFVEAVISSDELNNEIKITLLANLPNQLVRLAQSLDLNLQVIAKLTNHPQHLVTLAKTTNITFQDERAIVIYLQDHPDLLVEIAPHIKSPDTQYKIVESLQLNYDLLVEVKDSITAEVAKVQLDLFIKAHEQRLAQEKEYLDLVQNENIKLTLEQHRNIVIVLKDNPDALVQAAHRITRTSILLDIVLYLENYPEKLVEISGVIQDTAVLRELVRTLKPYPYSLEEISSKISNLTVQSDIIDALSCYPDSLITIAPRIAPANQLKLVNHLSRSTENLLEIVEYIQSQDARIALIEIILPKLLDQTLELNNSQIEAFANQIMLMEVELSDASKSQIKNIVFNAKFSPTLAKLAITLESMQASQEQLIPSASARFGSLVGYTQYLLGLPNNNDKHFREVIDFAQKATRGTNSNTDRVGIVPSGRNIS